MSAAVEVKNLVKRYKKAAVNAVDDVSFSVAEGEFFTLLGPNGAGKTTTISVLTTTLQKTSGSVMIHGRNLDREAQAIRREVGVIFQAPSTDLNLTAEENIRLHACLYGLYAFMPLFSLMSDEYKKRVSSLADVLGIKGSLFAPIKTFSGGMKRKLEIVRSLMHKPLVLFLDEPTTGLDPLSRRNLWEYLRDVRAREGTTIFLTTHYLEEAEKADHVCVIDEGKVVLYGTPSDMKRSLVRDYLLVDAHDRVRLMEELAPWAAAVEEGHPVRVCLGQGVEAQEVVRAISVPLTTLDIERPTLESAYLKLIETTNGT